MRTELSKGIFYRTSGTHEVHENRISGLFNQIECMCTDLTLECVCV